MREDELLVREDELLGGEEIVLERTKNLVEGSDIVAVRC